MQVSKISFSDPDFPDILRNLDVPPENINVLGELPKKTDKLVAIVGTRKCTPYGEKIAYQLASELAKTGVVVVSGLAIGIDGIAHRAALDAGGRTIAVLGHGLSEIYPYRHKAMAREILLRRGALISEYDLKVPPAKFRFPERNRIIAALADITVVVESPALGGSLLTAAAALKIGRQVMAVPGNITSLTSAGPNNLLREGAAPAVSSSDVMAALGFIAREAIPVPAQSPDEAAILNLLAVGPSSSEDLIDQLDLTAARFANIISLMEITGKVRNLGAGNWVAR